MELKILQINDSCTGCGACVNVCPKKCLSLEPNKEGFFYPLYMADNCIECHFCEKVCHALNPTPKEKVSKDDFYMYIADSEVRLKSSSGGGYSLFAEKILSLGGVVCGCTYNGKNERLEFFSSETTDWHLFRKSKYIEAYTNHIYTDIKNFIIDDRWVYFCGTPCQVRGLLQFLKAKNVKTTKLLTADFICHGVPSNRCFTEYKHMFENAKRHLVNVDFRHKDISKQKSAWHDLVLRLDFDDGTSKVIPRMPPYSYYYYYDLFLKNIILRQCCYSCTYPSVSLADVSFADFWGIYKYKPEIDDNTGISIIKLHTDKARNFWNDIPCRAEKLPWEYVKYLYEKPDKKPILKEKEHFFQLLERNGYKRAIRIYFRKDLLRYYLIGWLKNFVKNSLKKTGK